MNIWFVHVILLDHVSLKFELLYNQWRWFVFYKWLIITIWFYFSIKLQSVQRMNISGIIPSPALGFSYFIIFPTLNCFRVGLGVMYCARVEKVQAKQFSCVINVPFVGQDEAVSSWRFYVKTWPSRKLYV